jgi:hypothetical protein
MFPRGSPTLRRVLITGVTRMGRDGGRPQLRRRRRATTTVSCYDCHRHIVACLGGAR